MIVVIEKLQNRFISITISFDLSNQLLKTFSAPIGPHISQRRSIYLSEYCSVPKYKYIRNQLTFEHIIFVIYVATDQLGCSHTSKISRNHRQDSNTYTAYTRNSIYRFYTYITRSMCFVGKLSRDRRKRRRGRGCIFAGQRYCQSLAMHGPAQCRINLGVAISYIVRNTLRGTRSVTGGVSHGPSAHQRARKFRSTT